MPDPQDRVPEVIWTRSTQAPLSREQIAEAAVTIADTKGVEALSMRQIAAALKCGTMSLYRHVRTKEDVLDLMIDTVIGESRGWISKLSGDWRADLRALAWARRATVLRHPWLAPLLAGRPFLGPNVVANIEFALTAVAGLGRSVDEMVRMIGAVDAFVQGYVQIELSQREWRQPDEADGASTDDWQAAMGQYVEQLIRGGAYPWFARMVTEAEEYPDQDANFEWQLDRVLDGLAAAVEHPEKPDQPA